MFLAVDIGNTSIKFGLFDGDKLTSKFSIPTKRNARADEVKLAVDRRLNSDIRTAAVCSVVPSVNNSLRDLLHD
jgi:pantothenate kinase type III